MIEQVNKYKISIAWQTKLPRQVEAELYRRYSSFEHKNNVVSVIVECTRRGAQEIEEKILKILKKGLTA